MSSGRFPRHRSGNRSPKSGNGKDELMFDRDRDGQRYKRKYEENGGSRSRKPDPFPGPKYSNRYEQEETQMKRGPGGPPGFTNNGPMGGNMNRMGNMGGGMSDGFVHPPMPPPNQMMPNMMGNNMGNMGGMGGNNMGMGGNNMGMGGNNMGGMGDNPMGMNPMMNNGMPGPMMNMMGPNPMMNQFPMMGGMPDGNNMGPIVPNVGPNGILGMSQEFLNVFSKINAREPIGFSNFVLYPPSPNAPPPTTRERPLGCKTIFVGGLPENLKEPQLEELFLKCGEIQNIRLSPKRFAHIRFMSEVSVDTALYFSGCRIRIEDLMDNPNTGRLHIDFAQARDDQYEYECQQRALDRERRHQERILEEQFRVPSPLPVVHYSDSEASMMGEKLKNGDTFQEAIDVICTWLERGECNKRNANHFYTLLQSTNSHVRHMVSEKSMIDEEFQRARDMRDVKLIAIGKQCDTVEKVFSAASQKKVWDHFSKAQRKSIEAWKRAASDIKSLMPDSDNMDTDSEDEGPSKPKLARGGNIQTLKDENDSLRCQLEAYKNEVEILKLDMQTDLDVKDKQLKVSQKTVETLQMNLLEERRKQTDAAFESMKVKKELLALKLTQSGGGGENGDSKTISPSIVTEPLLELGATGVPEAEANLIGLISIFLHIHPFGASVEYIWSYVQKFLSSVKSTDLETIMARYPTLFTQDLFGIGANIERRWKYAGIPNQVTE